MNINCLGFTLIAYKQFGYWELVFFANQIVYILLQLLQLERFAIFG